MNSRGCEMGVLGKFLFPEQDDLSFKALIGCAIRYVLISWAFIAFLFICTGPIWLLI